MTNKIKMSQEEMIREYKYVMTRRAEINKRYDALRKRMIDYINDAGEVVDNDGLVQITYKPMTSSRFDSRLLHDDDPALYEKYRVQFDTLYLRNIKKPYPCTGQPIEKEEDWEAKMDSLEETICH